MLAEPVCIIQFMYIVEREKTRGQDLFKFLYNIFENKYLCT